MASLVCPSPYSETFVITIQFATIWIVTEDITLRKEAKHRRMSIEWFYEWAARTVRKLEWFAFRCYDNTMTKCNVGMKGFSIFQVIQSTLEGSKGTQTVAWSRNGKDTAHGFACCGIHLLAPEGWCEAGDMRTSTASSSTHTVQWRSSWNPIRVLQISFPMEEPHIFGSCYQDDMEKEIEKPDDCSHHPIAKWWPCCRWTSCKAKRSPTKEVPVEYFLCTKPKGFKGR